MAKSPFGVHSSRTHTISLTSNLASGLAHFFLAFRVGTYSLKSLFQIASSLCRTCIHVFVWTVGFSLKTHAGTLEKALPIRKWLGVSGSSSSTSLLTCVNGLALTRLSVSVTMVEKVSQVNFADPKFKRRARFTICTSLFHTPPKWGAEGGFRRHSTDWFSSFCLMNSWSSWSGCRRICFLAPRKLLPLSLRNNRGCPRLATNLRMAVMQVVVVKSSVTSKCTALVTRQLKRQI